MYYFLKVHKYFRFGIWVLSSFFVWIWNSFDLVFNLSFFPSHSLTLCIKRCHQREKFLFIVPLQFVYCFVINNALFAFLSKRRERQLWIILSVSFVCFQFWLFCCSKTQNTNVLWFEDSCHKVVQCSWLEPLDARRAEWMIKRNAVMCRLIRMTLLLSFYHCHNF